MATSQRIRNPLNAFARFDAANLECARIVANDPEMPLQKTVQAMEVRWARNLKLKDVEVIWDKPASACLSSRIAYGLPVTRETLESIEKGEDVLFAMDFRQFRVRHHGDLVRIEIAREELPRMLSLSVFAEVSAALKRLGYKYVTLDLEGYRSGSMNALLPASELVMSGVRINVAKTSETDS